jgi:hypothetical protein
MRDFGVVMFSWWRFQAIPDFDLVCVYPVIVVHVDGCIRVFRRILMQEFQVHEQQASQKPPTLARLFNEARGAIFDANEACEKVAIEEN